MNILHVASIKLTHILCILRSFWRFLPFEIFFTIIVIHVKRRSQGCTLRFRVISCEVFTPRITPDFNRCPSGLGLHPKKSFRSAFSSAILYDLRSLHPGTCLNTKTPSAFHWKRAFSTCISKFASPWLGFEQVD